MKKSFTLLITLFITLFISFAIISFINYSKSNINEQFHKDLAITRGYWAAYGAKEYGSDDDNKVYIYEDLSMNISDLRILYSMIGIKSSDTLYTFTIDLSSTIQDKDIFKRTLTTSSLTNYNDTVSYK